jgi:hypothetical protein
MLDQIVAEIPQVHCALDFSVNAILKMLVLFTNIWTMGNF